MSIPIYVDKGVTSLQQELGRSIDMAEVKERLGRELLADLLSK